MTEHAVGMPESLATADVWEWLEIRSGYRIGDRTAIEHTHTHTTVARPTHTQRFFERRFQWTGSSDTATRPEILSSSDGHDHVMHGPTYTEDDWTYYLVDLGHRVPAGQTETITTQQTFLDEKRTFKPYFRLLVRQPLQRLELTVDLPDNLAVRLRPTWTDGVSGNPYSVNSLNFHTDGSHAVLEVPNPQLGTEYGIAWL